MWAAVLGQASVSNGSPSFTINFSNSTASSVGTSPPSVFAGLGFEPNPTTAGMLNSNAWATTGFSGGALAFGTTAISGAHARGSTATAVTTEGIYAYTGLPATVSNPTLMIQPGISDFTPGTITLRIQNNGTTDLTQLAVSYNLFVNNDGDMSNSFYFSYSTNNIAYVPVGLLDYESPDALDASGWIVVGTFSTTIFLITSIPPGGFFYMRWTGDDFSGSGSRDEFGLDDISVTATFAAPSSYFRSAASGDWNTISTWESSIDNVTWGPATVAPTSSENTITIRNGHTVTIAASASADELTIQAGGILNHTNAVAFTLNNGTGTDMTINSGGIYILNGTQPAGSGTIEAQSGAIVRVSSNTAPGEGDDFGYGNANVTFRTGSVYEWATNSFVPLWDGRTYFTNGENTTFRFSQTPSSSLGGNSPTLIYGVLEANANIFIQGSGTKTFVNGIIGIANIDASAATGNIIINGATAVLGGGTLTTPPFPGLLQINNSAVTMTSNKTIAGDISLSVSKVDLGNNNLIVSGTISGGATAAYIKTSGTGTLTLNAIAPASFKDFPIGNSSYNPIRITNDVLNVTTDFSARVEDAINPGIALPTYGINRTWNINASAVTPKVLVRFQYATADANPSAVPPQNMEILQFSGAAWNILPGQTNIPPGGADPSWTITSNVAGINISTIPIPFVLGVNGGWILPIDCIISTRSRKVNNTGVISWEINSCAGVNNFEVQRSISGSTYQTIATITPGTQLTYNYIDAALSKGANLYRIKVNRWSGAVKYSNTVAVINESNGILITALSPNPVSDKTTLIINAAKAGNVSLAIYDINGRLVKHWQTTIADGSNNLIVDAKELSSGIYHLAAFADNSKAVIRFVKQ